MYPQLFSTLEGLRHRDGMEHTRTIKPVNHLSLGPSPHFFLNYEGTLYWNLPFSLKEEYRSDMSRVWLGSGQSWVIEYKRGAWKWLLGGNYPKLSKVFKREFGNYSCHDIKVSDVHLF
jgi:hypothetical protein